MAKCCSFTSSMDRWYRYSFMGAGLRSSTVDLKDGTVMHCWIPKSHKEKKPTLLLIHGLGANAMWQWDEFVTRLSSRFNVYVPDLVFFGESYTSNSERSVSFQARCVMGMMGTYGVRRMNVVGMSYGGFVAYSMAAEFTENVERVVLCCAGVCLEENDLKDGLFRVRTVEEAMSILLPQSPEKVRELIGYSFVKPARRIPTCFLNDFIQVMCTEHFQERKELVLALVKNRTQADLPRITQPTRIIWGEKDQIFPLELAYRLKRHIGGNAELAVIKNAGHAVTVEKPKEVYKDLKLFLVNTCMHTSKPKDGK